LNNLESRSGKGHSFTAEDRTRQIRATSLVYDGNLERTSKQLPPFSVIAEVFTDSFLPVFDTARVDCSFVHLKALKPRRGIYSDLAQPIAKYALLHLIFLYQKVSP
jgi:hypothetical protein